MTEKKFWSERIRAQTPYKAGEQPRIEKLIKLNTNENPYPPAPRVLEAVRTAASEDLRLYPPLLYDERRFLGNGSDEVLAMAFLAFFSGKKLYAPDITYSFYPVWAKMFEADYCTIPLNEDFTIPVEKFCELDGCVIIANPNAPTGIVLSAIEIERIVSSNRDNLVLIDEAYLDFSEVQSASELVEKYDNLLVVKTLSKSYSLAGIRVGWAEGNSDLIAALETVRDSFNSYTVDRVAWSAYCAAIDEKNYYSEQCRKVSATRERVKKSMREMGFAVTDSKANFLFASHPNKPAEEIYNALRESGILVRWWNLPRIDNYLRISIGTDAQMDIFLEKLREILQ